MPILAHINETGGNDLARRDATIRLLVQCLTNNPDPLGIALNPPSPRRAAPAFGALRAPVFRRWFVSQVLSASGTMTQAVAQSWLMLKLTGSGVDLGLLGSCTMLPMLLGGPLAGAMADRVDRRRLLVVTQSVFILLAGTLAVLTLTGSIRVWMLFVLGLATGTVAAPDAAARQVFVLDLVGGERLGSAVSLNEVVLNLSRVAGPALGGLFLATLGVGACFIANAASYLPPLAVLLGLHRARGAPPAGVAARQPAQRRGAVRAGLRYAWRSPEIRSLLLMAAASGMLFNLGVGLPLLATRTLHLGGGGYGLLMAAFGMGGVAGALVASSRRPVPRGRAVRRLAAATGIAILATAGAPDVPLAFAGMAATGCLSIWFIAQANTLAQLRADPSMRGRVMGIWGMALPGTTPVTGPLVGLTAQTAGPRAGFGLAGAALLLSAALGWQSLSAGGTTAAGAHPQPAAGAATTT